MLVASQLEDISNLQGYIDRTKTVLIYCSNGYFNSKNCMIELRSAVMKGKRIQPLLDPESNHGGLTREQIYDQLVAADANYSKWGFDDDGPKGAELEKALFEQDPIEWNRIGAFQDVTMRLIAAEALCIEGYQEPLKTSSRRRSAPAQ